MLSSGTSQESAEEMKDELVTASFVLDRDSKDEDRDIQLAELSKIFGSKELADSIKAKLKSFCDSHLGHEILLPDPQEEKWSQELAEGGSVFNDDGTFKKWVTNLLPNMERDQLDALSQEIINLIDDGSIQIKDYFEPGSDTQNKMNKAIEKFGTNFVTAYLKIITKSLMVRELMGLIEPEKNGRFVNIIVGLINHQLAIHDALLSEYQRVVNTRLLKNLDSQESWGNFLETADDRLLSVYGDNTKVMSLLQLGNAFAALPEKYTIHVFARHELLYEAEKFTKEQKGSGNINNLIQSLKNLNPPQQESESPDTDFLVERNEYAPLMFKYLLSKIGNILKNINDEAFKEQCERLYKQLSQQGDTLLNDVHCGKEDIGSHVKKLQKFCSVVEAANANDETVDICAEILRFYVPSPELFCDTKGNYFNDIQLYFKTAIGFLANGEKGSDLYLLMPALKLANAIIAADLKDESAKSYAFSVIPNMYKSQLCREDNELICSYLKVFNKIYSKIRVDERSVGEGEKKEDFSRERLEKSKMNVFWRYVQIVSIIKKLKHTGVDERITVEECFDILNHVTNELIDEGFTFETEYKLQAINSILQKLEIRGVGVNHRSTVKDFNFITQPYEKVKSILIRACLRKEIFYSEMGKQFKADIDNFIKLEANAESDIELYKTFENLQKLYGMSVGKKDALSIAAARIYSDACVEFKKTLCRAPTDLTQKQLNQVLVNVNEVILAIENNSSFLSPLIALNESQKDLPIKVNGMGVIWGSLICFIGLATMAAACYFSPMTLGSSLIAGEKIGYALVCAGFLIAGKGLHVIYSHSSSGVPKSLGGFLSAAKKERNQDNKAEPASVPVDADNLPFGVTGTVRLKKGLVSGS